MITLLAFALLQSPPIAPFATELRTAVQSGNQQRVTRLFQSAGEADYLFRMASGRGGLRGLQVAIIPAPPGWEATGKYWAVIHTYQDIEDYHDPVYPVVEVGPNFRLGKEIPEDATTGVQIKHASIDVRLFPADSKVQVKTKLDLTVTAQGRAPLFRLNNIYRIGDASLGSSKVNDFVKVGDTIPTPKAGSIVQAGSLLVPWTTRVQPQLTFDYTGTVNRPTEDKITEKVCYLTAWWVPSLGRLPHTTSTRVVGPADWILQSEGPRVATDLRAPEGMQVAEFKCDVPISYPKVIGGKYLLAAEQKIGDRTYRAYHLDSVDRARADKDVKIIADSIAWYEENLGPFPFNEYFCYDADTYYGIESYNYTLLQKRITTWAVGHEVAHTYFGGLVPSAYVHDSWNESVTQYVDSVLRQKNADKTLEQAFQSHQLNVPLTQMPVAHEYNSATYTRGAYILRMLENEIGLPAMLRALKAMIVDRRGRDTTWFSLQPYFEKSSGKKLDWFWRQWISSSTYPTLEIRDVQGIPHPNGTKVFVTVRQRGTASPYRLRFRVFTRSNNGSEASEVVEMNAPEQVFELNLGKNKAYEAGIDTFGYTYIPALRPQTVRF